MSYHHHTPGFHGFSVQWSPYLCNRLAVVSSQHYGIAGNGRLFILDKAFSRTPAHASTTSMPLHHVRSFDTPDGLFDVAWSELHENHLVVSSGDGSIRLYDVALTSPLPLRIYHEHTKEVYAVDWNTITKTTFISASWDHTVKLWDPSRSKSLCTYVGHDGLVYGVSWSPYVGDTFASCSGDNRVNIWDVRVTPRPVISIKAHDYEVLTCDWNKYDENVIVSGSVDKKICGWDIRQPTRPPFVLTGHKYAIRRLRCSPHDKNIIASASYDFSVRFWDAYKGTTLEVFDLHSEFATGIDFNLFNRGVVADCSWDEKTHVYSPLCLKPVDGRVQALVT